MIRKHLLFPLLFISNIAFSQILQDSNILQKYTSPYTYNIQTDDYILIELKKNAPEYIKNKMLILSVRKLSEGIFIIEKDQLPLIELDERFLKQYVLANDYWKLSPLAEDLRISRSKHKNSFRFTIAYKNADFTARLLHAYPHFDKKISELSSQSLLSIFATYEEIERLFLNNKDVLLIDVITTAPKEELAIGGFDLTANKINVVHSRYPAINGAGQHVSVKENYYDTTDIDLRGRLEFSPLASKTVTNHANFMATIIAGGGNSVYDAKGAAWGAGISSSSFEIVLPDPTSYYNQYNITVQNHSYGTVIDNSYGLNAAAFDKSANEKPDLLHVFSSGNSGNATSTLGMYAGIAGFANLTGNFKMAKNPIVVGASDSFGIVSPLSSKGPAHDGRIKPEMVAFEKNGTSEAAALVSGTALLLQQYYKEKNGNVLSSAMAKAILINSADDVNTSGPDYKTGFGNLNAIKAMDIIKFNSLLSGTVTQNAVQTYSINISQNISQLKITLVWNDIAATAFVSKALVNDLDLSLVSTATNEVWSPWVLSSFPHLDSLNKPPVRRRDDLNNVEQVTLQNPVAGNYQIKIHGFNLPSAQQGFHVAYSMDTINSFQWYHPAKTDFLETGRENILRWESTFTGTGDIEYNLLPSNTWLPVNVNADLTQKYFYWTPPDTTVQCLLRMKIGNSYFYSDTFLIATLPAPKVGFVCSDTILLYWKKIKGINQYQVYQLGSKYMDPFIKVSDTAVLLVKNNLTSKYFSVATILPNGVNGPKSYAFDYTTQGTGCYVQTFLADANGNVAKLTLLLGTTYNISKITYQRYKGGVFINIDSFPPAGQTSFTYNYQPLTPGITLFRTKITLQSGEIIYSNIASVFFVEPGKYILLPVPVKRNNNVEVLSTIPDGATIRFFDAMGRPVLQKEIHSAHEFIKTSSLPAGQYFYSITKDGVKITSGKLLIL